MNYLRTAMLLAGLTALFMGVGYLIGGQSGAMIALVVAAGMNLFSLLELRPAWCCRCTARRRSTRAPRPSSIAWCSELAQPRRPADAARLHHGQPAAERVRHRAQSASTPRSR